MSSTAEGAMYYLADLTLVFLVIYVKTAFSFLPLEERSAATLSWKTFLQKRKRERRCRCGLADESSCRLIKYLHYSHLVRSVHMHARTHTHLASCIFI